MLNQDETSPSDAYTHAGTRSDISTPASPNSLDLKDEHASGGKKRKRDGNTMGDLMKNNFVVKPYPSAGFAKSRTLQPLILLPRSHLPLSYLDTVTSTNVLPRSRLFEAHVKILELEERMGSQPMVLIARLDDGRTVYAVEREDRGLYCLCKLGSWVDLQHLRTVSAAPKGELPKSLERGFGTGETAMVTAPTLPNATQELNRFSKKKRLAIEAIQSMVKRPLTGTSTDSHPITPLELQPILKSQQHVLPVIQISQLPVTEVMEDCTAQPTAAEISKNLRTQYFEALYLSQASLAYFAKGPLSRARAAFHLDYDSTLDLNDHITFLESLILTNNLIEKKYRDAIPKCVSLIDIQGLSANDATQASTKKIKKRPKGLKPGKNGLFPAEDDLIRRWWSSHDDETNFGGPGSSKDELAKSRVSQLRIRETQLQLIVILEVLALQPLASIPENLEADLPSGSPRNVLVEDKDKAAKTKKHDNLTMLIDIHIDRLCIWQSIALEAEKSPAGDSQHAASSVSRNSNNILKDFCIEVIAPFFSSRLPDRCAVINRKLGGPVAVSPSKGKISKSASFCCGPSRPGAATKRPIPAKPRRSLKRVLTDDRERRSVSAGPNRAISLMRSATMPIVPGLKREPSDAPSLPSISTGYSLSLEANRGGIFRSKRFAQREVDLSSLVSEPSTKEQKQAKIDAELKEAIAALKKPNRGLAGKALAETAEKRAVEVSRSRKSKNPVRNPEFQGVQISATPRSNRQKYAAATQQASALPRMSEEMDIGKIPPSSLPRVPQSCQSSQIWMRTPLISIQATPTRKKPLASQARGDYSERPEDYGGFLPSSPLHARRSNSSLFPSVPEPTTKHHSENALGAGVQETPVKKPALNIEHSYPVTPQFTHDKENSREVTGQRLEHILGLNNDKRKEDSESIYKSLGWDDADDIG